MCVDGDITVTGTGRSPFAALIPICSGRNEGSSTLVKGSLTDKGDTIRQTAGPVSMAVHILENENSEYFTCIYCRDKLGLRKSSCMKVIEAWNLHYRVDPQKAKINEVTGKVEHK